MQQFDLCKFCGTHLIRPARLEENSVPVAIRCTNCGEELIWEPRPMEEEINGEEGAMQQIPIPQLELEIENEASITDGEDLSIETSTISDFDQNKISVTNFDGEEEAEPAPLRGPDWSVLESNLRRPRPREVSAFRKIIPPVLGGLAAIPIATAIMWYGFGKDIGSAGPVVAEYVPWIVPEKLRNTPAGNSAQDSLELRNQYTPRANRKFPSLDSEISTDINAKKAAHELKEEFSNLTSESVAVAPPETSANSISETIARLRSLQKRWYDTPDAGRRQFVIEYYTAIRQLSEQSSALSGRSAAVWRRELESISKEILSDPNIRTAIQRGAIGELPTIASASMQDFVATVILLGAENEPLPNASWTIHEKWAFGTAKLSIEVLPGAWRDSATLPARCLVLGKLVARVPSQPDLQQSQPMMILQVHSLLPQ